MSLQEMVNALLELEGMSQKKLAGQVGSSQPVIGRISKHNKVPSYTVGKNIERFYQENFSISNANMDEPVKNKNSDQ
ncbi:MAG: hypothetical protein RPT11_02990 [Bermanella sp.]